MTQYTYDTSRCFAHKIWVIDEIVRNILAHFPTRSEGTLASCARVSYALREPALDALWCRMSGLAPFLRLLPHFITEVRNESGDGTTFVLHRVIEDEEWLRLSDYARRVREFHYHYAHSPAERLGEHAFSALVRSATLRGTTLFPNLRELSWLQFSYATHYLPFLSKSLQRVTVYVQSGPFHVGREAHEHARHSTVNDCSGLLQFLDDRSPCVEELSLEGMDFPCPFESPILFRHLRTLHLGSVSTPVSVIISHCSKMPRLASLSVVLRGSSASNWSSRASSRGQDHVLAPSLSALEVLRIAGIPSEVEDVLDAVDSPVFHTAVLSVTVPDYDTDGWARCAHQLGSRFTTSLRTVRAEVTRSRMLVPTEARPFALYVQPLLPLRSMRECAITIEDPAGVAMTDGDVETIAAAWTGLTSFEVSFRGTQATTLPSITSLAAFARCCAQHLLTLHIPLSQDLSALAQLRAQDGSAPLTRRFDSVLRGLWLTGVRFSKAESGLVTAFLCHCFPDVNLLPMMNAGVLFVE